MTPASHLIKAVRESRSDISREYQGLLSELDLQQKFRNSVKHHPLRWISGAMAAGFLSTVFGAKSNPSSAKIPTQAKIAAADGVNTSLAKIGWLTGALQIGKLLYPVLRPVVMELATSAVQSGLAKKNRSQ